MSVSKSSSLAIPNVPDSINSTSEPFNEVDYWEEHLNSWQESGLSQKAYCEKHGLNYKVFCKWKGRFKVLPSGKSSIKLVEVKSSFRLNGGISGSPLGFAGAGSEGFSVANGAGFVGGGIRFWCGEFCIEVGAPFSSSCLSQLIKTLQSLNQRSDSFSGVENESCKCK